MLKIGIILSIAGMAWIAVVFLEGNRISEEFLLESTNSHSISHDFIGKDIGYYKVFMPEFAGDSMFAQILDAKGNVISEQSITTKMSVSYFDYEKSGKYTVKITNVGENLVDLQVELGSTNSQNMIPSGIMVLAGALLIIFASYVKLKNYKIAQPDENI